MAARTMVGLKWLAVPLALVLASGAQATWSIVIADSATKEVAAGTVTCLENLDLLALVPVVVVGKGAAASQALGDSTGERRAIIFENVILGTPPEEILSLLSQVEGHLYRQYGIADTEGRALTYTGLLANFWRGGVIGTDGSMVYAIQGNILVGDCVVPAIEAALLSTPGDIPAKLMAGMEAAAISGGDGRCSCSEEDPMGCGCPPADFEKPGHIGGMVVARIGDTDDPVCNAGGCCDGDYFMRLNVAFQMAGDPEPVQQLREQFDAWRIALQGRPDAIQSVVEFAPDPIPPNGVATTTMSVVLLDWQGVGITVPIGSLVVEHAPGSGGSSTIGAVTDEGGGHFTVEITAGTWPGVDRFRVTVDDGFRPVVLMPDPRLQYFALGDLNCDGVFNELDIDPFVEALVNPSSYAAAHPDCNIKNADLNGDGLVNSFDVDPFVNLLANDCNENGILDATDIVEGTSQDCNANAVPDECDIADGTSGDCNANDVPDECDIASELSDDCNANGVPDECDLADGTSEDCNENGVLDECDIASGYSLDCQPNGVPDECDLLPPDDSPARDVCADAELVCTNITYRGTTAEATVDGAASCGSSNATPDVWYYYTPYGNGFLTISLCGSGFDTVLSVHSDCPGTAANELACNDDYCQQQSRVDMLVLNGSSYWIRISGHDGSSGEFRMTLAGPACAYDAECNDNGIPDECEPDCNGNGQPDDCDIDAGTSADDNGNGIPDECEVAGDLNCDGVVNAFDIDPFVLALTSPDDYALAYPDCPRGNADVNADGVVDAFDIDPFVDLLSGGP